MQGVLYESTGGRKAKAYAPVREARLAIGLDLTGNHVSVVLVDLSAVAAPSTGDQRIVAKLAGPEVVAHIGMPPP